jgi:hypothetical protein
MINGAVTVGYLHPGHISHCFHKSLLDLFFLDAMGNNRIVGNPLHTAGEMAKECGAAHIHQGRNKVAATVLDESQAEWLFFIDSDMGFDGDTVERLIASADPTKRPVVGGLAFAQKSDGVGPFYGRRYRMLPTIYRMSQDDESVGFMAMLDYERDALVEVDGTGAACILIHRRALEKVRKTYGDVWFDPLKVPNPNGEGTTEFGEDLSFCLRLKACDIPLFVDTSVKTTHDKGGVFYDEESYDLQQALFDVAGA